MSSAFYAEMKAVADELIGDPEFGQPVVLTRDARTPTKVWQRDQGPAATSAAQSISGIFGLQIQLTKATRELQTIEQRLADWVLVASSTLPEELGTEWKLTSGGITYPLVSVRPVQPGDTLLLYFATVQL